MAVEPSSKNQPRATLKGATKKKTSPGFGRDSLKRTVLDLERLSFEVTES